MITRNDENIKSMNKDIDDELPKKCVIRLEELIIDFVMNYFFLNDIGTLTIVDVWTCAITCLLLLNF